MPTVVEMPKLGLTMIEGTVVEWLKSEGELVQQGEPLFVLETDKLTIEAEAPQSGVLCQIHVTPGTTVPTGTAVGLILAEGEEVDIQVEPPTSGAEPSQAREGRTRATPVVQRLAAEARLDPSAIEGTGPGGRVTSDDVDRARTQLHAGAAGVSAVPALATVQPDQPLTTTAQPRAKASPKAKRLAEKAGLDVAEIEGSGRGGRVMAQDVEQALEEARTSSTTPTQRAEAQTALPAVQAAGEVASKIVPLTGIRGVIAKHMSESAHATAAVTTTTQADAAQLVRLREALQAEWQPATGMAPSYNDLLVVILAKALGEFAYMNAHVVGEKIHQFEQISIGLAVDTDRGLVVPVIRNVGDLRLADVMHISRNLVERARAGRLLPDDLHGGTFTLSNMGAFDVEASTPIINAPECAILGVGRIAPRPAVVNGELCVRETVTLSLSYDHRAIDGAPAARFLERVKRLVEDPSLALVR